MFQKFKFNFLQQFLIIFIKFIFFIYLYLTKLNKMLKLFIFLNFYYNCLVERSGLLIKKKIFIFYIYQFQLSIFYIIITNISSLLFLSLLYQSFSILIFILFEVKVLHILLSCYLITSSQKKIICRLILFQIWYDRIKGKSSLFIKENH